MKQRDELRAERQAFADWLARHEDELRDERAALQKERDAVTASRATWDAARDRWQREKLEAEQVIRSLLKQIDGQIDRRPATGTAEAA